MSRNSRSSATSRSCKLESDIGADGEDDPRGAEASGPGTDEGSAAEASETGAVA